MTTSDYYTEWAQQYYLDEYDRLRLTVGRVLRKYDDERIDALMSDVVLKKLPDVLRTWDPSKAAGVDGHVTISIKWWIFKNIVKADSARNIENLWTDHDTDTAFEHLDFELALANSEEVELLQAGLTRQQWLTLSRRYIDGMTIQEMADKSCVSRGLIYNRLKDAMATAKHLTAYRPLYCAVVFALKELLNENQHCE